MLAIQSPSASDTSAIVASMAVDTINSYYIHDSLDSSCSGHNRNNQYNEHLEFVN